MSMATSDPIGICRLDEDANLAFEKVVNLPLEMELVLQMPISVKADMEPPAKAEEDWHNAVDLAHIENDSLKV